MSEGLETAPTAVLVVLHGHDSTVAEADSLARAVDPDGRLHHVLPEGPLETSSGAREWFSTAPGTLATAEALLGGLLSELGAAGLPIVVVGYSQGGAVALGALTAEGAPSVSAVACLSGYLPEAPGLDHDLGRLVGSRVLVQHGRDDEVVPDVFAADLVAALDAAGVEVTAQFFEMGHERTPASVEAARAWLAAVVG